MPSLAIEENTGRNTIQNAEQPQDVVIKKHKTASGHHWSVCLLFVQFQCGYTFLMRKRRKPKPIPRIQPSIVLVPVEVYWSVAGRAARFFSHRCGPFHPRVILLFTLSLSATLHCFSQPRHLDDGRCRLELILSDNQDGEYK